MVCLCSRVVSESFVLVFIGGHRRFSSTFLFLYSIRFPDLKALRCFGVTRIYHCLQRNRIRLFFRFNRFELHPLSSTYKLTSFDGSEVGVTKSSPALLLLLLFKTLLPFTPPKFRPNPKFSDAAAAIDDDDEVVGYVGTRGCETGVKPVPPSIKLSKLNMTPFDGVEIETPAISAIFLHWDGVMANGTASELGRFGRCAGIVGVFRVVGVSQPDRADALIMGLWCMESSIRLADGGPSSKSSWSGVSIVSELPSSKELVFIERSSCGSTLMCCSTLIFSSDKSMGRGTWTVEAVTMAPVDVGLVVMT